MINYNHKDKEPAQDINSDDSSKRHTDTLYAYSLDSKLPYPVIFGRIKANMGIRKALGSREGVSKNNGTLSCLFYGCNE